MPEYLKGMFIIKAKARTASGQEEEEGTEDDIQLQEKLMEEELALEYPSEFCQGVLSDSQKLLWRGSLVDRSSAIQDQISPLTSTGSSNYSYTKSTAAEELNDYYGMITMAGKKLISFTEPNRHGLHVASINEKQMMRLEKCNSTGDLVSWHQNYLSRIYPAGTRVWSSNYNPANAWSWGSQMVALNYQAADTAMFLNKGKFQENGSCGYVLKPLILRMPNIGFDPFKIKADALKRANERSLVLTIQVLAAQQLLNMFKRRRVSTEPKPYATFISVSVHGVPQDSKMYKTNQLVTSEINPRWKDQLFRFHIAVPSLASVYFEVRTNDAVRSEVMAGCAVPVMCMREGIRWVPLLDNRLREIRCCGLLVHVDKQPWEFVAETADFKSVLP